MPTYRRRAPKSDEQIRAESQGLKGQNYDRQLARAGVVVVDGTIYFMGVVLRSGQIVTNIHPELLVVGAGVTVAKVGIYTCAASTATLVASSADLGTAWHSGTGVKTHALSAAYTVPTDGLYYLALICKFSTTAPTFTMQNNAGGSGGVLSPGIRSHATLAAQTDLATPATVTSTSPLSYWVGWS